MVEFQPFQQLQLSYLLFNRTRHHQSDAIQQGGILFLRLDLLPSRISSNGELKALEFGPKR